MKGRTARGTLDGFVDAGAHVDGTLRFEHSFRVDGRVTGVVESLGELVIGPQGVVEGEVRVGSLVISGRLRGTAWTRERLEIGTGAHVEGEIHTPVLVVEDGAVFEGRCCMVEGAAAPRPEVVTPHAQGGKVAALSRPRSG